MNKEFQNFQDLIKELLNTDQYLKALDLLTDQSTNPLLNLQEQNIINTQLNGLLDFIKQNKNSEQINSYDKDKLIKAFLNKDYSLTILDVLLTKFIKQLTNNDYMMLNQVFLDQTIENNLKIIFLNIFKDWNINFEFNYFNNKTQKTFKINPVANFDLIDVIFLNRVYLDLTDLFFKDISKQNMAIQILIAIYNYYFFEYDFQYDNNQLMHNIADFVEYTFNNLYPIDQSFLKWINKIML